LENFPWLEAIFAYARDRRLAEVELLRLKPAGRGADNFREARMTPEQNRALFPQLQALSERSGVRAKVDCSFVPMICCHQPPRHLLEALGTYGCEAGNVLVGARSDGTVSGCSFLAGDGMTVFELAARWREDGTALARFRNWRRRAPEPCAGCCYLDLCNGGCHAVAAFLCGDPDAPDPDCPIVAAQAVVD